MARGYKGFSGYYRGWYFRSLRELSFALQLDKDNRKWIGAEKEEYCAYYNDRFGKKRRHYADFVLVEERLIVEVKPTTKMKQVGVQLKAEAMKKWCNENNYTYLMVQPKKLGKEDLRKLLTDKNISFDNPKAIRGYINA